MLALSANETSAPTGRGPSTKAVAPKPNCKMDGWLWVQGLPEQSV